MKVTVQNYKTTEGNPVPEPNKDRQSRKPWDRRRSTETTIHVLVHSEANLDTFEIVKKEFTVIQILWKRFNYYIKTLWKEIFVCVIIIS